MGARTERITSKRRKGEEEQKATLAWLKARRDEIGLTALALPHKRKISNSAVFDAGREPRQDSAPWAGAAFAIRLTPGRSPSA